MAKSKKNSSKKPTDAELEILHVLWQRGPTTVRAVFNELAARREVGYTTVLKVMQIMSEKGLVTRDESVRPQVYKSTRSQNQTERLVLTDVLERVFQGSPGKLVLQALSSKSTTPEELAEIRVLLDRLEAKNKNESGGKA